MKRHLSTLGQQYRQQNANVYQTNGWELIRKIIAQIMVKGFNFHAMANSAERETDWF